MPQKTRQTIILNLEGSNTFSPGFFSPLLISHQIRRLFELVPLPLGHLYFAARMAQLRVFD